MEMKWLCIMLGCFLMSSLMAMSIYSDAEQKTERVRIQYDCIKKLIN